MPPSVLVAGLDARGLLLEASILQRDGHQVRERPSGRELIAELSACGARLVVLGPRLPDLPLPELIRRIRASPFTRGVSVLALVPADEPATLDVEAGASGANAVLRRPLKQDRLNAWVAKLLAVPQRILARVPVQGHVVGTPRVEGMGHFLGLARNVSVNGILLASPVPLEGSPDVELEMFLRDAVPVRALGRVVREAREVAWPYRGYGVEFLYVPLDSLNAIIDFVASELVFSAAAGLPAAGPPPPLAAAIRSTIRREAWIYEILEPVQQHGAWQVEIRRAPREAWRPGAAGPFYVVEGPSPERALVEARAFLARQD